MASLPAPALAKINPWKPRSDDGKYDLANPSVSDMESVTEALRMKKLAMIAALVFGHLSTVQADTATPSLSTPALLEVTVVHGVQLSFGSYNAAGAEVLIKVKGPAPYADCAIQGHAAGLNVQRVSVVGRRMTCNDGADRYIIQGYVVGSDDIIGLPAVASVPPTPDAAIGVLVLTAKAGVAKFVVTDIQHG